MNRKVTINARHLALRCRRFWSRDNISFTDAWLTFMARVGGHWVHVLNE
jgi:hypothetical protein